MSKTYNQLTSTLSAKDVNGHTVTMKGSGCGVCSVAAIAYNIKTSYTLEKVWEYMVSKGYTIREGTTRTGVTEVIKHYGMKSTYYSPAYSGSKFDDLMTALKKCATEKRWGILLMYGHSSHKEAKNDYWTHGGHFICVTDYDKDKGFYVRDSANGRTGYHKKSEFEGCIVAGWVVTPENVTTASETQKAETKEVTKVYHAKCTAKLGVNIRTSTGKDTGKNVPYGKTVLVKKKNACVTIINGVKYTMMKVTYGTTTGYVAQKLFKFV